MLFFHIPKILLLYKKLNDWTSILNLLDAIGIEDSVSLEETVHTVCSVMSQIIKNEATLENLKLDIKKVANHYDWSQYIPKLVRMCKEQSGEIVKLIAREMSFLFDNNPNAFENIKKRVEVNRNFYGSMHECKLNFTGCPEPVQTRLKVISKFNAKLQCFSINITPKHLTADKDNAQENSQNASG